MRSTFDVTFYLKKRFLKKGENPKSMEFPVMCRITIKGEAKILTCKLSLPESMWDITTHRARGRSDEDR